MQIRRGSHWGGQSIVTDQKLSWLERTFPRWAKNRAQFRAKTTHFKRFENDTEYRNLFLALMNARGYRSAKTGANQTPWLGGNNSADNEVINDLPALINRSREINRDDPLGSGVTGTFVRNVIGTGIRPQARTGDTDRNAAQEAVWSDRKDTLCPGDDITYAKHQEVTLRKVLEDGGILIKEARVAPGEPVWFEMVEKSRLRTPVGITKSDKEDPEGTVVDGVEKDRYGRATAYWIAKFKPLNVSIGGVASVSIATTKADFERIPKESCRYLRLIERPGQTHGVPLFHAILQDLRDLDLLILATLKTMQVTACLSVFIESPEAFEDLVEATVEKYHIELKKDLEPGMIMKLYPGEKVSTLIPNFPTSQYEPFILMLARRIGAALGVSYQIVLKDFSNANYSSARTDLLESRQVFVGLQKWLIEKVFDWEWQVVMLDAKLRGDKRLRTVPREDLAKVHWIPNGWKWVDPVKEAHATQVKLQIGLTTLRDECAAQGNDWEEIMEQRLQEELVEINRRKEMGLPPPVRIVVLPPKKKGTLPTGEEDDLEDDDENEEEKLAFALESRISGLPGSGGNGGH